MRLLLNVSILKYRFVLTLFILLSLLPREGLGQWVQADSEMGYGSIVNCIVINGNNIFAGTYYGGIFLSIDNGESWIAADSGLANPDDSTVFALAVDNGNLIAGTDGGIFLTSNNGISWNPIDSGLGSRYNFALASNGDTLIAGTNNGLYRSTNNGIFWVADDSGISETPIHSFAVSGDNLFVGMALGEIALSTDNGTSWMPVNIGMNNLHFESLAVNGGDLFASNDSGVFLSTNNGTSWRPIGLRNENVTGLAFYHGDIFAGTPRDGIFLSTDTGASWTSVNDGLNNVYSLSVFSIAINDNYLFVGTSGDGVWRRPISEMIGSSIVASEPQQTPTLTISPNPVSHKATISFSSAVSTPTNVSIYNLLGSEVAQLYDGTLDVGSHSFTWDASGATSGAYICVVRMNGQVLRVPIVVTK
jgi:photosystem II stability/assembly factor-like uncharacterized protein